MSVQAPCGHPGEYVIGTYVRCLQGCTKDPHTSAYQPPAPKKGEPGHVDLCACPACTVRRRGNEVVLRTKDGREVRLPWDGAKPKVSWTADMQVTVRHWKLVDKDGDVLLDGTCNLNVPPGDVIDIDLRLLRLELVHRVRRLRRFELAWNEAYWLEWRGYTGTYDSIRAAALDIAGVEDVDVSCPVHGEVLVRILATYATDQQAEDSILRGVRQKLAGVIPAGIQLDVRLDTPLARLSRVRAYALATHATVASLTARVEAEFRDYQDPTVVVTQDTVRVAYTYKGIRRYVCTYLV